MSTAIITTSAYAGSNKLRIDLYKATASNTVIDTKGPFTGPQAQRDWIFEDLIPGDTYIYKLLEVDPSSGAVLNTLITENISIDNYGTLIYRAPFNVVVDITPNVVSGATTALLDGSNGSPDFRGEKIIPVLDGVGPLYESFTYSFNSTTGLFSRLGGTIFNPGERYFIAFQPKQTASSPAPTVRDAWSSILNVTDDIVLTAADFGKNLMIKGNDGYLKITLPDIFTVIPGRLLYVTSTTGSHKCAEITCSAISGNGSLIMWPFDNLNSIFIGISENLAIYCEQVSDAVRYWRVVYPDGNFKTVGEIIGEYTNPAHVINKVILDDTEYDVLEQARLYDYISNLPGGEVVPFASWSTGDNKYKFSSADGSGKFHVPDLRDKYERASGTNPAGTYQANTIKAHTHAIAYILEGNDGAPTASGQVLKKADGDGHGSEQGGDGVNSYAIQSTGGAETRPETVIVNKYMRC